MNSDDINYSLNNQKGQSLLESFKSSKKRKILLYGLICLLIIIIILILIFTLKSNNETTENKNELPSIFIEKLNTSNFCRFSILTLNCSNLNYYKDIKNTDISFQFTSNNFSNIYFSDEIIENSIKIKIPFDAISGNVTMNINKLNFKYNFSIEIIQNFSIKLNENIINKEGNDIVIKEEEISCTKNNYYIIYSFISPCSGKFDIELFASSNNDKSFINVDIDTNITYLEKRGRNVKNLTNHIISGAWVDFHKYIYGSFYLEENKEYFLKISFIKTDSGFACNLANIKFIPNEDQNKIVYDTGYTIYEFDFINNCYFPFYAGWAYYPNYIKIENEYAEFYYNQNAYDNHTGVRQYKGAELTGQFATNRDGWYGYKFYLDEIFPKNISSTIITQLFNQGRSNTWAGHLHIKNQYLVLGYRSNAAASSEIDIIICEINWNEWYNLIIYFKVGRNNKGRIKIWLTKDKDEPLENNPIFDSGDSNFGFGSWIDDETLNNTKIEENGQTNQIGCKFGLYTCEGG